MSEIYNADYYHKYDVGVGKVEYETSAYTKDFLKTVADFGLKQTIAAEPHLHAHQ